MKRSGFARKRYLPPPPAPVRRSTRAGVICRIDPHVLAIPKENLIVLEAYRALVRQLPCARCGRPPPNQFCHADEGKGMALKTDDRRGWAGCGPHDGLMGCHYLLGCTGYFSQRERRRLEREYARWTRYQILAGGLWPPELPLLPEDESWQDPSLAV